MCRGGGPDPIVHGAYALLRIGSLNPQGRRTGHTGSVRTDGAFGSAIFSLRLLIPSACLVVDSCCMYVFVSPCLNGTHASKEWPWLDSVSGSSLPSRSACRGDVAGCSCPELYRNDAQLRGNGRLGRRHVHERTRHDGHRSGCWVLLTDRHLSNLEPRRSAADCGRR